MNKRLVVVSNRLPVAISGDEITGYSISPGTGGLVTALESIVKQTKGAWIGWPGCSSNVPFEPLLKDYSRNSDFDLIPVDITEDEIAKFYRGFSNKSIWPLFHDLLGQFSFKPDEYEVYKNVNKKYAKKIADNIRATDSIWIHDYQLMLVGRYLRDLEINGNISFFLHIPFPSIDLLRRFPRKTELTKSLLSYNQNSFR